MIAFINFMENIILLSQNELAKITNHRSGEVKFGEKIITVPKDADIVEFIANSEAKFVLFGIPEDIRQCGMNYLPKELASIVEEFETKYGR